MKTAVAALFVLLSSVSSQASRPPVIDSASVTCAEANALLSRHGQLTVIYKDIFGFSSRANVTTDPQCPFTTIAQASYFRTQDRRVCQVGFYTACAADPAYQGGGSQK